MVQIAQGWELAVERGPDWLFVRPRSVGGGLGSMPNLADEVWALLNQSFTRRLVLEMHEVPFLHSYLIGQLVLLGKRLHAENGLMRICGLSAANQDTLRACHLESRFPLYSSREDAVMASRPIQPR